MDHALKESKSIVAWTGFAEKQFYLLSCVCHSVFQIDNSTSSWLLEQLYSWHDMGLVGTNISEVYIRCKFSYSWDLLVIFILVLIFDSWNIIWNCYYRWLTEYSIAIHTFLSCFTHSIWFYMSFCLSDSTSEKVCYFSTNFLFLTLFLWKRSSEIVAIVRELKIPFLQNLTLVRL